MKFTDILMPNLLLLLPNPYESLTLHVFHICLHWGG